MEPLLNRNPKRKDIFDRIMHFPILNRFEHLYISHKEGLLYLFFGLLSFLISIGTYALFSEVFLINVLISNIFAWFLSVSFAYITNRIWVFKNNATGFSSILIEIGKFISGRLISLGIEELILYIFITNIGLNSMIVKTAATVIVIVLNYIISKLWVFKGK